MQVFIVQLLHWLVDNDVVQVELDTPTVLQNLRHDLFERCWCRCQPKTNTLEPKNSFVHYKRCYIPTRKVEASPMVGWCQVQLRKVWHSSHWVEEFINMGQWKGVENDSLIWFTQVDARTNFPIWLLDDDNLGNPLWCICTFDDALVFHPKTLRGNFITQRHGQTTQLGPHGLNMVHTVTYGFFTNRSTVLKRDWNSSNPSGSFYTYRVDEGLVDSGGMRWCLAGVRLGLASLMKTCLLACLKTCLDGLAWEVDARLDNVEGRLLSRTWASLTSHCGACPGSAVLTYKQSYPRRQKKTVVNGLFTAYM